MNKRKKSKQKEKGLDTNPPDINIVNLEVHEDGKVSKELTELYRLIHSGKINLKTPSLEAIPDWLLEKFGQDDTEDINTSINEAGILLYLEHKRAITKKSKIELTGEELNQAMFSFTTAISWESLKRKEILDYKHNHIFDWDGKIDVTLTETGIEIMKAMKSQRDKKNKR